MTRVSLRVVGASAGGEVGEYIEDGGGKLQGFYVVICVVDWEGVSSLEKAVGEVGVRFLFSDIIVCGQKFGVGKRGPDGGDDEYLRQWKIVWMKSLSLGGTVRNSVLFNVNVEACDGGCSCGLRDEVFSIRVMRGNAGRRHTFESPLPAGSTHEARTTSNPYGIFPLTSSTVKLQFPNF